MGSSSLQDIILNLGPGERSEGTLHDDKFKPCGFLTQFPVCALRCIKIWDRGTFEIHCVAEQAESLAPPMAWQPNGRHLFTVQHQSMGTSMKSGEENRHRIKLYERNGLAHGGFDLDQGLGMIDLLHALNPAYVIPSQSPSGDVRSLTWSQDSELLVIVTAPPEAQEQGNEMNKWSLQVWPPITNACS